MCHSLIAKPPFLSPLKAMAGAGLLSPPFLLSPLFIRDWKKGIMRWEESVMAQCIRVFYFASWVEQKHHCPAVLRKIKTFKKSESWNNSNLQPGCLWVLTFLWLLLCDAFCVSEGVEKAPVRQRKARENTNKIGQKSHRDKQIFKFLILGAEWAVPCCGDGPWDLEYSLFKSIFFCISHISPSVIYLLLWYTSYMRNLTVKSLFLVTRITHNMVKPHYLIPALLRPSKSGPSPRRPMGVWGAGGVVSHQPWAKQWELQQCCFPNAASSQQVGFISALVVFC